MHQADRTCEAGRLGVVVCVVATVIPSGVSTGDVAGFEVLRTADGVRFGVMGSKRPSPAPTLFTFQGSIESSLSMEVYGKIGRLLERQGFLVISLDLPCHGEDARRHESQELEGWAARLGNGEDIVGEFNKRASRVLDYLIARRCTDPQKVAVCGTSRGGFMAIHWMASEPRVRCVVAFAPVTRLPILREFAALEAHPAVRSLALESLAAKLAGRPIWVTIGNQDTRVGTDSVISFTRHIVKASMAASRPADVELHVMPIVGHTTHPTAHDEAAAWILARIQARR